MFTFFGLCVCSFHAEPRQLCAEAGNEQIEHLETYKDGITVAEYWTELTSKKVLEEKLHQSLIEARERIVRKQLK